eukprot:gnl/TRDRNA2_/TRDRNA2_28086_c0_seq2.p1 gnl/TRDRNA2_/TRDRNA2_28086_c0~~gnl/TRDRNA2_/TRDRNA2_28086_c0_seq2.p1  ORF type:complete len:245 (-),score=32.15 gnl/TRDRNA2_/TRDRNA2_28086_c0_seq2:54-788(-)
MISADSQLTPSPCVDFGARLLSVAIFAVLTFSLGGCAGVQQSEDFAGCVMAEVARDMGGACPKTCLDAVALEGANGWAPSCADGTGGRAEEAKDGSELAELGCRCLQAVPSYISTVMHCCKKHKVLARGAEFLQQVSGDVGSRLLCERPLGAQANMSAAFGAHCTGTHASAMAEFRLPSLVAIEGRVGGVFEERVQASSLSLAFAGLMATAATAGAACIFAVWRHRRRQKVCRPHTAASPTMVS